MQDFLFLCLMSCRMLFCRYGGLCHEQTDRKSAERVTLPAENISLLVELSSIRPAGRFTLRLIADLIIQPWLMLLEPWGWLWLRLIIPMS